MTRKATDQVTTIGIDIGKNTFRQPNKPFRQHPPRISGHSSIPVQASD